MMIDMFRKIRCKKKLFAFYFRNMFILLNLKTSASFSIVKCVTAVYGFIDNYQLRLKVVF